MKKTIAGAASTLMLLTAGFGLAAAPPAASLQSDFYLVTIFGNDGGSQTPTQLFTGDGVPSAKIPEWDPNDPNFPNGFVESSVPADPALFDSQQNVYFYVPSVDSSFNLVTDKTELLFTFGSSWSSSATVPSQDPYGVAQGNPVRQLESGADLESENSSVFVTRCSEAWVLDTPGENNTDVRPQCNGTEKTTLIIGTAPDPDPGNGGSSGSGAGSSAPTLDLTLDPTETDATCSVAGVSGARGSWVTLEAASDCTPPPSTPDATLLGWATDPDFPVDIAQRQVDNGWGTYETYNDDGQLTSVFIPAGGAAQLTNSNTLYAIWSDTSAGS